LTEAQAEGAITEEEVALCSDLVELGVKGVEALVLETKTSLVELLLSSQ
jgi:hypothetical protein